MIARSVAILAQPVDILPEWAFRLAPYACAFALGWPILLLPYAIWRALKKRRDPNRGVQR